MNESIYDAWHRRLGHAEYRVTLTMTGYGSDDQAAEDFLEGYLEAHPDAGPVVSQNSEEDTMSVTLSVRASGQQRALDLAVDLWVTGGVKSGVPPGEAVRAEIELVGDHEAAETGEQVYA
jgi:hypothetical protein